MSANQNQNNNLLLTQPFEDEKLKARFSIVEDVQVEAEYHTCSPYSLRQIIPVSIGKFLLIARQYS